MDKISAQAACSICGKPTVEKFKPFCSARCAQIDLGRWLGEHYRIPTQEVAEDDEAPPPTTGQAE